MTNSEKVEIYKDCLELLYLDLSKNIIHRYCDYNLIRDRIGQALRDAEREV